MLFEKLIEFCCKNFSSLPIESYLASFCMKDIKKTKEWKVSSA